MADISEQPLDLEELLLRVLSHEATDQEVARLNRLLGESAELRSQACQFLCDDALASSIFQTQGEADRIEKISQRAQQLAAEINQPARPKGLFGRTYEFVNSHGLAVAAIGAMLLVGLTFYNMTLRHKLHRLHGLVVVDPAEQPPKAKWRGKSRGGHRDNQGEIVGRVSGLHNPSWTANGKPLSFGDRIRSGQSIDIESGAVELLLSTGAKITIEGPAHFTASSPLESVLSKGKLAAAAPRSARGYTVLTPTSELVDIGTQFGVMVEDSGDSELHVFDGDVVARSLKTTDLIHAKQDEAMRFNSASPTPQRIASRKNDFLRHIAPLYDPSDLPSLPSTKGLAIWYAADHCDTVAGSNKIGVWKDLLVGDNDFADNAWQFDEVRRPQLVKDGSGRPAVLFDGWSTFLASSPVEPAKQQTVFIACMPAPVNYAEKQMLFMYGAAPSMELWLEKDNAVRGWVWPGPGSECVGDLLSASLENQRPSVVAYQYDTINDSAKLWVNGVLQGTSTAPVGSPQASQRYLGRHRDPPFKSEYFGHIYEVVVYDGVFEDSKLDDFWGYFARRHK